MNDDSRTPSPSSAEAPRRRILRKIGYLLYLLAFLELGARAYWTLERGVPLRAHTYDWYALYFPGLVNSGIADAELGPDDGHFDVLLLGGSVLGKLHAHHAHVLRNALSFAVGEPARLYNLAYPAHTTRDSVLKYRLLRDRPVDLVIVYHGINDARMNNCSREMFRDDYTHAAWYHEIERMEAHVGLLPYLVLPFTLEKQLITILGDAPKEVMTRFGGEIKTIEPFRRNLSEIVKMAGRTATPVLVMTFDWYLPERYSLDAFTAGELDYDAHIHATEVWGTPPHVVAAIEAHNDVLRTYADDAPDNVIYLDVQPVVPDGRAYWDDICHLTDAGERLWLRAMANAVARRLGP
jgi:hypothetical protein